MVTAEKLRRMRKQDTLLYRKQVDVKLPLLQRPGNTDEGRPFLPRLDEQAQVRESHEDKLHRTLQDLEARYDQRMASTTETVRYITGCKSAYQDAMSGVLEDYAAQDVPHAGLVGLVWSRYQQLFDSMQEQVNAMQQTHHVEGERFTEELTNMRFNYLQAMENLETSITENAASLLSHTQEMKAAEEAHRKEVAARDAQIEELQDQVEKAKLAQQAAQAALRQAKVDCDDKIAAAVDESNAATVATDRSRLVLRDAHECIIRLIVHAKYKRLPTDANRLRPDPELVEIENTALPDVPPFPTLVEAGVMTEEEEPESPRALTRVKSKANRSMMNLKNLKGSNGSSKGRGGRRSDKDADSDGDTLSVSSKTSRSAKEQSKRRKKSSLGEISSTSKGKKKRDRTKSDSQSHHTSDTLGSQLGGRSRQSSRADTCVTAEL